MANHHQHHHHLQPPNHLQQPPTSPSSAAYQHFQPWRSVKTEKPDSMDKHDPQTFYNPLEHSADPSRLLLAGHPGAIPLQYTNYPLSTTSVTEPQQQHVNNNSNPELEMKLQQCIEEGNGVGDFAKKQIVQILESISLLKPPERVLLYLRMPGANCETDPLRQPQNPLGARSEINHTINWVRTHLEPDPNVSIPKKDVYDDYTGFCGRNNIKPLSTADFGKVMKQVFPTVRPRRLGMRGHSRYCYAAMRKATKLDPPLLPNLSSPGTSSSMGGGGTGFLNGPHVSFSPSEVQSKCASNVDHSPAWEVIRRWAEGALKHSFESSNDLAEYIIKCNLMGEHRGMDGEFKSGPSGTMKEGKKVKDKRKEPTVAKLNNSPKKRRKKRRKESSSADGASGAESEGPVRVKREVESGNDEDQIIDLKIQSNKMSSEVAQQMLADRKTPVKLLLNDMPLDATVPAASVSGAESLQIENVFCKKVRQAQQAKGLWFQQQNQSQQSPQPQQQQQSSVIVTPHTFSQPEIPSPSMLNQANAIRQQLLSERGEGSSMPKNLNKREGGSDDAIPSDFILPRERVISLCTLDKDALDDYLPLAGDNSQEAEIMEYFDENSSNGPSNGDGTETNSPKGDDGGLGSAQTGGQSSSSSLDTSSSATIDAYSIFSGQLSGGGGGNAGLKAMPNGEGLGEGGVQSEKISQIRQILHQNLSQQTLNQQMNVGGGGNANYTGGSASASLTMLSQRHHQAVNYPMSSMGIDLTNSSGAGAAGRPVSLKKRVISECEENAHETGQRRFVPIAPPPQSLAPNIDYGKSAVNRVATNKYDDFLSPKMTTVKKSLAQQMDLQTNRHAVGMDYGAISLVHSGAGCSGSTPLDNGIGLINSGKQTAFSRPKTDNRPSPTDVQEALNMSTFAESRSQSVPLNYRQSPVQQVVTSSNEGGSWSSSYQNNNNNANSSACSSVAQTPIPAEYNDFTEYINIWENDSSVMGPERQDGGVIGGGTAGSGSGGPSGGEAATAEEEKMYRDGNNNSSNTNNNDDFTDEMKAFAATTSSSIISRSVPSTPIPSSAMYYPKAFVGTNGGGGGGVVLVGQVGGFAEYGQTQQRRYCDVSKSVPTTPIASTSSHFRYSPEREMLNRSRDSLISGFGFDGDGRVMGDGERIVAMSISSNARRRIEKIEEDRKMSSVAEGGVGGGGEEDKEMSPLEEEMGFDPMMDPDLMNQFKEQF